MCRFPCRFVKKGRPFFDKLKNLPHLFQRRTRANSMVAIFSTAPPDMT